MGGATELEPGEVFAERYEVQRLLGEGDRKRTYLARDAKMDRLVAISLVKPEGVLSDPEGTEREAKVLGRIGEHDNIVSLYNYEIDGGGLVHYMVFEYLSGGTLAEYLRKSGQRSLDEVLRLGRQLCRGLAHLHKRASFIGTCHRRMCGSMSVMWPTSATSIQQSPPRAPVIFDRSRRIRSLPPRS